MIYLPLPSTLPLVTFPFVCVCVCVWGKKILVSAILFVTLFHLNRSKQDEDEQKTGDSDFMFTVAMMLGVLP